jgi:hypothetical protein
VLSANLEPNSEAGRALQAAAAACPCLVSGADASLPAADARAALGAARAVWAASWDPGPLGVRLRAGRAVEVDGRLRFERAGGAEVTGLVFSRDPASARRGRALVEAAAGASDALLDGAAAADRYDLDAASGRTREAVLAGARPVLSPERLRRVARLARALDAWRGGGVEAAFAISGGKLLVLHVRPLEPPRPLEPLRDPLGPAPAAEALSVKSVR